MEVGRRNRSTLPEVPTVALWEAHLRLARKLYNNSRFKAQDQLHTFAPRKFLGVVGPNRRSLWRIPEAEDPDAIEEMKWRGLWSATTLTERNWYMAHTLTEQLIAKGMDHPFPASPTRNPRFGLKFINAEDERLAFHNFYGRFAAKRFLDAVISGDTYTWLDDDTILIAGRIKVQGERKTDLEAIIEHEDNKLERQWEMAAPYPQFAMSIRGGRPQEEDDNPVRRKIEPAIERPTRAKAPSRHRSRKAPPAGLVTVAQLADELGITSREARQRLRKANIAKPDGGWQWPADAAVKIKELLK